MTSEKEKKSSGVFTRAYWLGIWNMVKRCFTAYGRKYLYLQLVCRGGSADFIARGVGIGLFVGFMIPFGVQMPIALILAFVLKAEKILSLAFTFVTNHVTIFFIYPMQCYVGGMLLGNRITLDEISKQFDSVFAQQTELAKFNALCAMGGELAASFFVGGFLFAVAAAIPGYFITKFLVESYRKRRESKQLQRRESRKRTAVERLK